MQSTGVKVIALSYASPISEPPVSPTHLSEDCRNEVEETPYSTHRSLMRFVWGPNREEDHIGGSIVSILLLRLKKQFWNCLSF